MNGISSRPLPKVGAIGLSLPLYSKTPGYFDRLRGVWNSFLTELSTEAAVAENIFTCDADEVAAFCKKAESLQLDAIVVSALSYCASLTALQALCDCRLPLVIWNTQFADRIENSFSNDDLIMNHTVQGIHDLGNCLWQKKRQFFIASGNYRNKNTLSKLRQFLNAAHTFNSGTINILEMGGQFEGMGDFDYDHQQAAEQLNYRLTSASCEELRELFHAGPDEAVNAETALFAERFCIDPALPEKVLFDSVKMHLAFQQLRNKYNADAFTMNFLALNECTTLPVIPFLGINMGIADGMGYAGEGDSLRAGLMAAMHRLTNSANFTEIYTIDFERNLMLMSHMQECNMRWAHPLRKVRLIERPWQQPGKTSFAGMHFNTAPGKVTLVTITPDGNGRFRYITALVNVPENPLLKNFPKPHWLADPQIPVEQFLDRYSELGGCHHLSAVAGDHREAIRALAILQNQDYVEVK